MTKGGTLTHDSPQGLEEVFHPSRICTDTVEVDLFPPDPDLVKRAPPEPDHIEGLSLRMTQAMNHYQKQEHQMLSCTGTQDTSRGIVHTAKLSAHGTRNI